MLKECQQCGRPKHQFTEVDKVHIQDSIWKVYYSCVCGNYMSENVDQFVDNSKTQYRYVPDLFWEKDNPKDKYKEEFTNRDRYWEKVKAEAKAKYDDANIGVVISNNLDGSHLDAEEDWVDDKI